MVFVGLWRRVMVAMAVFSPLLLSAQTEFVGKLDGRLHVDPASLAVVTFDAVSAGDARLLGARLAPGDKAFAGVLFLSNEDALKYKAVIVRSPGGSDVLYVDANHDGHFEPSERIPFRLLTPSDPHLKSSRTFDVVLPGGPFKSCPMEVRLLKDGVPTPAGPKQVAVLFTSSAFVEGDVPLPGGPLRVRFQYRFNNGTVDLGRSNEWVDLNGDGRFDVTPGSQEFLLARGSAPVFRVANLTLQVQSLDLQQERFVVHSVAASLDQRIPLFVGAVLPDFEFTDFAGARRHLSDVRGKYILLDFWAAWCGPCVHELPFQKKAYQEFHRRGFEILGMNGDTSIKDPKHCSTNSASVGCRRDSTKLYLKTGCR